MRRSVTTAMLAGIIAVVATLCTQEIPSGVLTSWLRAMPGSVMRPAAAQPAAPGHVPPDRLGAMRARGELRVCIWPAYFGLSWRNPRSAELEGMDVDMARLLALRLGLQLIFVETTSQAIPGALEAGQCDIGMSGVTVTQERATRIAFTKPYLSTPLVGIANRASLRVQSWADVDRRGMVVAVAEAAPAEALMRASLARAELAVLPASRRHEGEVLAGRADIFITDMPYGRGLSMQQDWVRLVGAPPHFGQTLMAYAVPRGDAAWLAEANAFLATVKTEGQLARAADRAGLLALLALLVY